MNPFVDESDLPDWNADAEFEDHYDPDRGDWRPAVTVELPPFDESAASGGGS